MSIFDFILNRRNHNEPVADDRRDGKMKRLAAASKRVDKASEDLCQTISMNRADFNAVMRKESIHEVIQFHTFAEMCEFRSAPENSLSQICKHPEHEAASTGIAPCKASNCPLMPKP